jgi:hypothetical protein
MAAAAPPSFEPVILLAGLAGLLNSFLVGPSVAAPPAALSLSAQPMVRQLGGQADLWPSHQVLPPRANQARSHSPAGLLILVWLVRFPLQLALAAAL